MGCSSFFLNQNLRHWSNKCRRTRFFYSEIPHQSLICGVQVQICDHLMNDLSVRPSPPILPRSGKSLPGVSIFPRVKQTLWQRWGSAGGGRSGLLGDQDPLLTVRISFPGSLNGGDLLLTGPRSVRCSCFSWAAWIDHATAAANGAEGRAQRWSIRKDVSLRPQPGIDKGKNS